jgi:hypothetical protein
VVEVGPGHASELHRHFYGTFLVRRLRRKARLLPKFGKVQKKKLMENSELRREITSYCGHAGQRRQPQTSCGVGEMLHCCRRCGVRRDEQRIVEPELWLFAPGPL